MTDTRKKLWLIQVLRREDVISFYQIPKAGVPMNERFLIFRRNLIHDADGAERLTIRPIEGEAIIRLDSMLGPYRVFLPIRVFGRIWNVERFLLNDYLCAEGVHLKRKGCANCKLDCFPDRWKKLGGNPFPLFDILVMLSRQISWQRD